MGQRKKKDADVSTPSLAYQAMEPEWTKMTTVLAGTQSMRDAGTDMAPMHEHEKQKHYDERITGNVLFNVTDLTLRTWVGKPFSASIQYTDDFSEFAKPWMDDLDLLGNNADVFCRQWFRKGVSHALCHVMVSFPRLDFFPGRSTKDDAEENIRPYCVQINPEDLIFAESQRINGKEVLTHIRIRELYTYRDGWEEILDERIRVMDLDWIFPDEDNDLVEPQQVVRVTVWVYDDAQKAWVPNEEFYMDIDMIPLVTFYADRTGFMTGKSPLLDLCDLNIRHWQSNSDQISILTCARFPMLALSGGDEEDQPYVIGPKEFLFCNEAGSKFYYVEPKGAGIKAGQDDLTKLEEQMKSYGAEFMKKSPDRQTASARNLDSSEATSPLQDVVYRFNDALAQVLWLMAYWVRKDIVGKAFLPTEWTSPESSTLQVLLETWKEGGIADEAYLKELQRRSILDENFDFAKNKEQLAKQAKAAAKKAEQELERSRDGVDPERDSETNQ